MAFILVYAAFARAQYELIVIEKPFYARNFAGTILDPSGAPVAGAVVEECAALASPVEYRNPNDPRIGLLHADCDPDQHHVLASAVTDAGGHFVLPRTRNLTVRYLHVEAKGFDPLQIVVKRRSTAPAELRVTLHLGA
jgi:hypothetical protein